MDNPLEIKGNQALLVIVFTNLIKMVFLYSEDKNKHYNPSKIGY